MTVGLMHEEPVPRPRRASAAVGTAAFALAGGVAAAGGGYFPVSWGWTSLALLCAIAVRLLAWPRVALTALDATALGALASLVAWTWLSALWSPSATQPALEGQRALLYLAALGAVLVVVDRRETRALLGGALTAVTLACAYGVATRVFPDRLGTFDSVAEYRLAEPLGYWNALGIFAVMGALVALGFVARGRAALSRALACAALVPLATALYFTFSRGAWLALAAGVVIVLLAEPRRGVLLLALAAAAPAPAAAVALASRSDALTTRGAPLADAVAEGRDLALVLVGLAAVAAALGAALGLRRRARWIALAAAAAVVAAGAVAGADRLPAPSGAGGGVDLNTRLFRLDTNGRADMWAVALERYNEVPVVGTGAGGFERTWLERRTFPLKVRDAHSLYVEVLAELGPVGLGLVVVALGAPLLAWRRARSRPLASTTLGAYAAFVLHAGVDWDWEVPAVTICGLVLGGALLLGARGTERELAPRTARVLALAVVPLLAVVLVALAGNLALDRSRDAAREGDFAAAQKHARRATRWAPWSIEADRALGAAQLGAGDAAAAADTLAAAVQRDPGDWAAWFDFARAVTGAEQEFALERARELNPLSTEIARFAAGRGDPGEGAIPLP